ncbi:MAG TPA: galactokinase family protein [Chloroflexota bacterium]|nr:galactokinase family protein [Chloroflexota bacterium]
MSSASHKDRPSFARAVDGMRTALGVDARAVQLLFSPYRVCPLGAHVDHQDGVVTGFAIDQGVAFAFAPRGDTTVRAASANFAGGVRFDLTRIPPAASGDWGNFARGAAAALQSRGHRLERGVDLYLAGELPVGGLSSSAAVGTGYLLALEAANGLDVTAEENVALARAIENEYVGLNSGVLDQSMILLSREDALLRLDCRTMGRDYVGFGGSAPPVVGVAYSGVSQALVGTGYNQRVAECREAARVLLEAAHLPVPDGGARLRDVPVEAYERLKDALPDPLGKRARHYFGEQARVAAGAEAWGGGDVTRFGRLVSESGRSSIENYECGAPELIALYEALLHGPGVYGARFSGAGFRGSCLALVDPAHFETVGERVRAAYVGQFPQYAETFGFFRCAPGPAAHVVGGAGATA